MFPGSDVENFNIFFKDQYKKQAAKEFYGVEVIGLQSTGHWCLSREVRTNFHDNWV